jgi:hypothetical protein
MLLKRGAREEPETWDLIISLQSLLISFSIVVAYTIDFPIVFYFADDFPNKIFHLL